MKKFLFVFTILFSALLITGCFFEDVTSIRLKSGFKTNWELDEKINLHDIQIEVMVNDKITETVYGDSEGVVIQGFDTSTSGQKTAVITYNKVSINISYTVIGDDSKASTVEALYNLLLEGTVSTITLNPGVYDFSLLSQQTTNPTIKRSVVIRAPQGVNVVIRNAKIAFEKGKSASVVEFRNIKFDTPFVYNSSSRTLMKIDSAREVDDSTLVTNLDRVIFDNCEFIADEGTYGIIVDNKTCLEVRNSKFTTNSIDDYFVYMISTGSTKVKNNYLIIENNVFRCNFWYGLGNITNAIIRGNLFEQTIPVDSHLRDGYYAPIYNVGKNPVAFHVSTAKSGANMGKMNLVVTNNTIKNVESLFRIYQTDRFMYTEAYDMARDLEVSNNIIENVNILVMYSAVAYTKDFATHILQGVNGTPKRMTKTVIAQNTEFIMPEGAEFGFYRDSTTAKESLIYKGLIYQEKNTEDDENRYYYIGNIYSEDAKDAKYMLAKKVGDVVNYYTIEVSYSADGKDTRTITPIVNQTTITRLNSYLSAGYIVVEDFE